MKRRIYSDKYIDGEIAKIDAMFEKNNNCFDEYPSELINEGESVYISKRLQANLNKYIKRRIDQSYVQGFWYGWSLRNGMKDTE